MCFCEGTLIRTPGGEVRVEDLRAGDLIATATAEGTGEIIWVGRRGYITKSIYLEDWETLVPVRIVQGTLGDSLPRQDLLISPDHAICLENKLIPVRHLVNGDSIAYFDAPDAIRYFQIELPSHQVLFAEGVALESYRDIGDRNKFGNVREALARSGRTTRPSEPYLQVVTAGDTLVQLRRAQAERTPRACPPDRPTLDNLRPSRPHRISCDVAQAVTGTLYRNILSRNSDAAGFRYYMNCFMTGRKTINAAIREFFVSSEFLEKFAANLTPDQMSRRLLTGFFGEEGFSDHDLKFVRTTVMRSGIGQAVEMLLNDRRFLELHGIMGIPHY
jgi:hypothetical protein